MQGHDGYLYSRRWAAAIMRGTVPERLILLDRRHPIYIGNRGLFTHRFLDISVKFLANILAS
jgi:hypothetical protein